MKGKRFYGEAETRAEKQPVPRKVTSAARLQPIIQALLVLVIALDYCRVSADEDE